MARDKHNNIFKSIFLEISYFIKSLGLGVFTIIDTLFTLIASLCSYVYYGINTIFKFIWQKLFKYIFLELKIFFEGLSKGSFLIMKFLFYDILAFIIRSFSSLFYYIYKKTKVSNERFKQFIKDFPEKIKNYIQKKIDNIGIVKYYRNKRERELEILQINTTGEDAKRTEIKHTYEYLVRNKAGKLIKGYFPALSKLDTHSYLLDEGYEVYEIKTNKWIDFIHGQNATFNKRMNNKDLIFWLAQVSTYVKSGVPLTDAIKILAKQDKKRSHKKLYDSLIYELTMGESLSESMKKQGKVYPPLLINMIKAAEMIGDIEGTLDEMSNYYSEMEDTKKAMIQAVSYPTIIFIFAITVVTFMLVYIIPQFENIYLQAGAEINGALAFSLKLSAFLKNQYMLILFIVLIVCLAFNVLYRNVKAFRAGVQYFIMHIPVIGKVIIYKEMNLFSKTFSVLNKNNVLLTDSIDILSKITNNEIYKMLMFDTISNLLRGDKMSKSFENNWAVPELAYYMITTGEGTGELSTMLEKVSDYYQKEQKSIVNVLKTFLEPFLIIFLAVVVGGIVISVIVPMFGLYGNIL